MAIYQLKLIRERISNMDPHPIRNSVDVVDYVRSSNCFASEDFWRETVVALMVGSDGVPLGHYFVSEGAADRCIIDFRSVAMVAVRTGAKAVVIVHNHPNGNPKPSQIDIEQTQKLKRYLSAVEVEILDHVIVCEKEYYSFQDECVRKADLFGVRELLLTKVEDLGLSQRLANALLAAGIRDVKDVVSLSRADLGKVRNIGARGLREVLMFIENNHLSCGMDVSGYIGVTGTNLL